MISDIDPQTGRKSTRKHSRGSPSGWRRARRFLPVAVLAAAVLAVFAFDLHHYVSFEMLRENRTLLVGYVDTHAWLASLIYLGIYAAAVAISFPGASLLTIAGGFLFGTVHAGLLTVVGATIGAVVVFLAARYAFADLLRRKASPWLRRMEDGFNRDAFSYLLTLRLLPIFPFWLVNLVPALIGVRLGTYTLTTALGIIPGTIVYAAVGNGLGATLEASEHPDLAIIFEPEILLPLIGLALLSLAPVVYRRVRRRRGS